MRKYEDQGLLEGLYCVFCKGRGSCYYEIQCFKW